MGVVWKALDTSLDRDVAIGFLVNRVNSEGTEVPSCKARSNRIGEAEVAQRFWTPPGRFITTGGTQ